MPSNDYPLPKNQRLIRKVAKGDQTAFEALYDRFNAPLYNYLLRLTHDQTVSENLLQETFLAIWEGAGNYRGDSNVKNWFYAIAHNKAINWLRKTLKDGQSREIPLNNDAHKQEDSKVNPEEITFTKAQTEDIQDSLGQLSAPHRAVLELAYVHEFTYQEIAQIMGCPEGTVKSRMSYALQRLSGILKQLS